MRFGYEKWYLRSIYLLPKIRTVQAEKWPRWRKRDVPWRALRLWFIFRIFCLCHTFLCVCHPLNVNKYFVLFCLCYCRCIWARNMRVTYNVNSNVCVYNVRVCAIAHENRDSITFIFCLYIVCYFFYQYWQFVHLIFVHDSVFGFGDISPGQKKHDKQLCFKHISHHVSSIWRTHRVKC